MSGGEAMNWTRRLPAQSGWYWYRNTEEGGQMPWAEVGLPVVLEIEHEGQSNVIWVYRMDWADPLVAEDFPGEWAGPIKPPK